MLILSCLPLQFNHTMLRIKDPKVSIPFYTEVSLPSIVYIPSLTLSKSFSPSISYNQIIGMDLVESEQIVSCALQPAHMKT